MKRPLLFLAFFIAIAFSSLTLKAQSLKIPKCDLDMTEALKESEAPEYNSFIDQLCNSLNSKQADSASFYLKKILDKTPDVAYFQELNSSLNIYKNYKEPQEDSESENTNEVISHTIKCDVGRYADEHNADQKWNKLIDDACKEINTGNYKNAIKLLQEAIEIDSDATGTVNEFLKNQLKKLKMNLNEEVVEMQPENKNESKKSDDKKQEVKPIVTETPVQANTENNKTNVLKEEEKPPVKETTSDTKVKAESIPVKEAEQKTNEQPVEITAPPIANEIQLDEATETEFKDKGLAKVKDLELYIKLITDKSQSSSDVDNAIESAINLFESEDKTVQVTSIAKTEKRQIKIRKYLTNLKNLTYTKIEIEWSDIYYISKIRKTRDGNYVGVIEFAQTFIGYVEDKPKYKDKTFKSIEVIIKKYSKVNNGETNDGWDVMLGDISVKETRP